MSGVRTLPGCFESGVRQLIAETRTKWRQRAEAHERAAAEADVLGAETAQQPDETVERGEAGDKEGRDETESEA